MKSHCGSREVQGKGIAGDGKNQALCGRLCGSAAKSKESPMSGAAGGETEEARRTQVLGGGGGGTPRFVGEKSGGVAENGE